MTSLKAIRYPVWPLCCEGTRSGGGGSDRPGDGTRTERADCQLFRQLIPLFSSPPVEERFPLIGLYRLYSSTPRREVRDAYPVSCLFFPVACVRSFSRGIHPHPFPGKQKVRRCSSPPSPTSRALMVVPLPPNPLPLSGDRYPPSTSPPAEWYVWCEGREAKSGRLKESALVYFSAYFSCPCLSL